MKVILTDFLYLDFGYFEHYYDLSMMPRVKASNTSKIKSVLYDFPDELMQNPNNCAFL